MARARIKREAVVRVISGESKGQSGKVLSVKAGEKVTVEGVNLRKRATRRSADDPQGGIKEIECPVHISNVMLEDEYQARQAKRKA